MNLTFTQNLDTTANQPKKNKSTYLAEPSIQTINTILNYSKNLVIKKSKFIKELEYIKS